MVCNVFVCNVWKAGGNNLYLSHLISFPWIVKYKNYKLNSSCFFIPRGRLHRLTKLELVSCFLFKYSHTIGYNTTQYIIFSIFYNQFKSSIKLSVSKPLLKNMIIMKEAKLFTFDNVC